jgi:glycosyltransferase involved in cell wall biosynthesis
MQPGPFGRLPFIGNSLTFRGSLRARNQLRAAQREQPFDALFLHTQTVAAFVPDVMARIPTMISIDATPAQFNVMRPVYGIGEVGRLKEHLQTRVYRDIFARAKRLTTWSEWAKQSLVSDYRVPGEKVIVVSPGSDLNTLRPSTERGPLNSSRRLQVLFVGGDFIRKGGDTLLAAFERHLRERVELHLVTSDTFELPQTPFVHAYQNLAPHSDELMRLFRRADVFVLPTRADANPVAGIEAMAAGLALVTSDVGALRELVIGGENGFVVPVDDIELLAKRIETLSSDAALCARMQARSRQLAETKFDQNKNTNRLGDALVAMAAASI